MQPSATDVLQSSRETQSALSLVKLLSRVFRPQVKGEIGPRRCEIRLAESNVGPTRLWHHVSPP